jgi:hypothetical protein
MPGSDPTQIDQAGVRGIARPCAPSNGRTLAGAERVASWALTAEGRIGLAVPGRPIGPCRGGPERRRRPRRDGTGTLVGPCWVRSRPVNCRQQRAGADTERCPEPQDAGPTAL